MISTVRMPIVSVRVLAIQPDDARAAGSTGFSSAPASSRHRFFREDAAGNSHEHVLRQSRFADEHSA